MLVHIGIDPVFLELGGLRIGWHGLFTVLAVALALWMASRRARTAGMDESQFATVATWAILGGFIGARLFHVLDHLDYFFDHPLEVFAVWNGGIAVYGSFIGGIVAGYIVAKRLRLGIWMLFDVAAPVMLVGQMVGRLGCLSNGDAWGEPTGGSWGVVYTHPGALLPSSLIGVPTHPYPAYEFVACALVLGVAWVLRRSFTTPGSLFIFVAFSYAAIRFGLTFFRQEPVLFWGLQEAQVVGMVSAAILLLVVLYRQFGTSNGRSAPGITSP